MLESLQGRLIFGRTTIIRPLQAGPHAGAYRVDDHRLARPDGAVLEGWSSTPLDVPATGALLYFGGRNESGFGGSTGRASERRAKADARAMLDFVVARNPAAELAIAGRSLGTAVALWLAREARPRRLVLMSPFESVPAVLRMRPLARFAAPVLAQRFHCAELAAARTGETLVLLAETDTTVPHAQSRALCASLPAALTEQVVAGTTHRSLPRARAAQEAVARFLAVQKW
jgi:alpha/beta superfamily hydrolase